MITTKIPLAGQSVRRYRAAKDAVLRTANGLIMEVMTDQLLLTGAEVALQLQCALAGGVTNRLAHLRNAWNAACCANCRVSVGDGNSLSTTTPAVWTMCKPSSPQMAGDRAMVSVRMKILCSMTYCLIRENPTLSICSKRRIKERRPRCQYGA